MPSKFHGHIQRELHIDYENWWRFQSSEIMDWWVLHVFLIVDGLCRSYICKLSLTIKFLSQTSPSTTVRSIEERSAASSKKQKRKQLTQRLAQYSCLKPKEIARLLRVDVSTVYQEWRMLAKTIKVSEAESFAKVRRVIINEDEAAQFFAE